MKKTILIISILTLILVNLLGQTDGGLNRVPVVNGKVVFEHFVITNPNQSTQQNYAKLQNWVRSKYSESPLLSGIRFDDESNFATVSTGTNLTLPANSAGVMEGMTMNYRFDASITGGGCMIVIRDVTFQNVKKEGDSFFPKRLTAEQTITDQLINAPGTDTELNSNLRKASLDYINLLFLEFDSMF